MSTSTVKLTLSADPALVREARRLATRRKTSISALFSSFLRTEAAQDAPAATSLAPLTRQASGLINLPADVTDRELLEAALTSRGRRKA